MLSFLPLAGLAYTMFPPSLPLAGVGCTSYRNPVFFLGIAATLFGDICRKVTLLFQENSIKVHFCIKKFVSFVKNA